jgi:NADH-quinone oxidoreductase subunit H
MDHLMSFSWKVLIPVTLVNIVATGFGLYIFKGIGG